VRPNLDQIVIRVIGENTTRLVELQRGVVDFTRPIPHDQIPNLRRQAPDIRFERERQRSYDYIAYNPKAMDAFADPEIRRALSLGIDARGLIRALQMEDFATPAAGPYAPIFRDLYDPRQLPPLPYDTAQAKRILEAKGWRDADGDGIREKDGKPFRFTLLTNAGNPRKADVQQIVQQQLRRVGVDVRLQQLEFNTFQERQLAQEYEALLGTWIVGLSADITALWAEGTPQNFVSFRNPRVKQLFEQALSQPSEQAAAPYWRAAAEQIARDQPYTFLYFFDQVSGVRNRLQGVKIDTYGAYQNAWEWWVRDGGGGAAAPPADTSAR
jgi:peptide/nickel transport system substrate-binding protein